MTSGPYTYVGDINPLFAVHPYVPAPGKPPSVWHEYTMPCQQSGFAVLPNMLDSHGLPVVMWQGDGWQQAPDGRKDHDPQVLSTHQIIFCPWIYSFVRAAESLH